MMPNKSIYRDADAAEINLYELNFARFFSIQTSENGWRRVVCELVRRNSSKNPLEDWKQAVNYYYAGAAQGDAECAAAVGYCCEMDPRGSNLPLALAWYQHAAKAGSAWAMEKVATFYEEGYGCTANRALADACRETLKYMR